MTPEVAAQQSQPVTSAKGSALPVVETRRALFGFWAAAFALLIVMASATLPSPLYGLYRIRDHLSALTVTVIYAIFAGGTIAALLSVRLIVTRAGRRGTMLGAVATMMAAAALLAAWKALPGLLIGRLLTGVAVGLAAGTAITYLIELRARANPNGSPTRAQTMGTAVTVGGLGIGPLIAGCLAQWVKHPLTLPYFLFVALGAIALIGLAAAPETGNPAPPASAASKASGPSRSGRVLVPGAAATLAAFAASGALIGAGAGAVFKGTTGLVLGATAPENRLAATSDLLIALYVGLSIPVIGAGVALDRGASAPATVLGFAIVVGAGVAGAGAFLGHGLESVPRPRNPTQT